MKDEYVALATVMVVTFCLVFVPFAQIWAINTLFGTTVAYNLTNWFAIWVFCWGLRLWVVPTFKSK
jgi:hypothetical protein